MEDAQNEYEESYLHAWRSVRLPFETMASAIPAVLMKIFVFFDRNESEGLVGQDGTWRLPPEELPPIEDVVEDGSLGTRARL